MSDLALICFWIGILVIVVRGPLIFAPAATIGFYRQLLSTDTRVRVVGVVGAGLGLALVFSAQNASALAVLGWVLVTGSLLLLGFPASYRSIADNVLDFAEGDRVLRRVVGAIGVTIGVVLVYLGGWVL
jgi:uncharacterized protein YjeT (DUF2065 family)